jgi:hypothetical protein
LHLLRGNFIAFLDIEKAMVLPTGLGFWSNLDDVIFGHGLRFVFDLERWWRVQRQRRCAVDLVHRAIGHELGVESHFLWRQDDRIGKENLFFLMIKKIL